MRAGFTIQRSVMDFRTLRNIAAKCAVIWLFTSGLVAGCSSHCDNEVTTSIGSPDGKYEASIVRVNCGATTDYVYNVFITKSNSNLRKSKDDALFVADHVKELGIEWKNKNSLSIQYSQARIYKFRNFWRPDILHKTKSIKITENEISTRKLR